MGKRYADFLPESHEPERELHDELAPVLGPRTRRGFVHGPEWAHSVLRLMPYEKSSEGWNVDVLTVLAEDDDEGAGVVADELARCFTQYGAMPIASVTVRTIVREYENVILEHRRLT